MERRRNQWHLQLECRIELVELMLNKAKSTVAEPSVAIDRP
jgi:hypothetical protein